MRVTCANCSTGLDVAETLLQQREYVSCPVCQGEVPLQTPTSAAQCSEPAPAEPPRAGGSPSFPSETLNPPPKPRTWMLLAGAAVIGICIAVSVFAVAIATASTGNTPADAKSDLAKQLPEKQTPADDTHDILVELTERLNREIEQLKRDHAEARRQLEQSQRELDQIRLENRSLQEKVVLVERWRKATFVVTSKRAAVGIRPTDQGQFRVVATAVFPHTDYVLHVARRLNIPRIFQADKIALKLSEEVGRDFVSEELAVQLRKFWRIHRPVQPGPGEDAIFVTFKDMETDRQRVGFLLGVTDTSLRFQPVAPSIETISRDRIESGTPRKGTADRILAEPETDFLDLCILRMAQHLASAEAVPGWLSLAVHVQTDALEEELARSGSGGSGEPRLFDDRTLSGLNPYRGNGGTEPILILRRFAVHLHDEIGSRLSRLDIPVVEREELDSLIAERDLADTRSFEPRDYAGLFSVSHVVIVDVDKPRNDGDFRVSIRLVAADTGRKLFEDNGDMGRKPAAIPERYMLSSGRLALLSTTKQGTLIRNQMAPLWLPADLRATPAGRIVLAEPAVGKRSVYQELFGHQVRTIADHAAQAGLSSVRSDNAVPPSQQLRVVSWQIAKSVLPAAGRIVRIEENRVTIAISPDHGVTNGDRFRVMRSHKSAIAQDAMVPPATSVLPVRVRADVIADDHVVGYLVESGLEQLWPESTLEVGDLALREGIDTPRVCISSPQFDATLLSNAAAARSRRLLPSQVRRLRDNMDHLAVRLQTALVNAMQKIGVRVVNSPEGATHLVGGGVAPVTGEPDCERFVIQLGTVYATSGEQVASVLPITLTTAEVESWRP